MCTVNINRVSSKCSKNNQYLLSVLYVVLFAQRSKTQSRLGSCQKRQRCVALLGRGAYRSLILFAGHAFVLNNLCFKQSVRSFVTVCGLMLHIRD